MSSKNDLIEEMSKSQTLFMKRFLVNNYINLGFIKSASENVDTFLSIEIAEFEEKIKTISEIIKIMKE